MRGSIPKRRRAPRKTILVKIAILRLFELIICGIINTKHFPGNRIQVYFLAVKKEMLYGLQV